MNLPKSKHFIHFNNLIFLPFRTTYLHFYLDIFCESDKQRTMQFDENEGIFLDFICLYVEISRIKANFFSNKNHAHFIQRL